MNLKFRLFIKIHGRLNLDRNIGKNKLTNQTIEKKEYFNRRLNVNIPNFQMIKNANVKEHMKTIKVLKYALNAYQILIKCWHLNK